jgi:hypothetical protein
MLTPMYGIEKVSLSDVLANGWDAYVGKMVQITTPLYECGNYYDSLILSQRSRFRPWCEQGMPIW